MKRRVQVGKFGVWGALAAGPLALAVAVTASPTVVEAAAPEPVAPPAGEAKGATADPSGYAEVFVSAWLRSPADGPDAEDGADAQASIAQSLAPDVELPQPSAKADAIDSVVTVRSARRGSGRWAVTVAAQYESGTVRFFVVPVAVGRGGGSFTVEAAPGAVGSPSPAPVSKSPYSVPVGDDSSVGRAVREFFTAYLTGAGEVDRYLAPGVSVSAATGFDTVVVQDVLAAEDSAAGEKVPADGTRVRVRAAVRAVDARGQWPLTYELALVSRAGRWELAALETGLKGEGARS